MNIQGSRRRRIALLTVGTRGDTQPFAALALALMRSGYEIRLAAPRNFASWIEDLGIPYTPLGADTQAYLHSKDFQTYFRSGTLSRLRSSWKTLRPMLHSIMEDLPAAVDNADAVICHLTAKLAFDVCEARGIPAAFAAFQPVTETAEFPLLVLKPRTLGPMLNRFSYKIQQLSYIGVQRDVNLWRQRTLGLKPQRVGAPVVDPLSGERPAILYGISPAILPRPRDWPDRAYLTGYWFLDDSPEWVPPPRLAAFLQAGEQPIYVGLGSLPAGVAPDAPGVLLAALRRTGLRALVDRGWGAMSLTEGEAMETTLAVENLPHQHLLPLTRAVVHHGGAGITAAALRAGRPSLVCPFNTDQPWWGRRVAALGAGPHSLPLKRWTEDGLSSALVDLTRNSTYVRAAKELSERMEGEDGPGCAVRAVRDVFGPPQMQ